MSYGYVGFYRNKKVKIQAESLIAAKEKAVTFFRAKRPHEVSVVLVEKPGQAVSHSTAAFG